MMTNFTLNQLTRLLYRETSSEETGMLYELMKYCPSLKKQYDEMKKTKTLLGRRKNKPSNHSVNTILMYSQMKPSHL